MGEAEGKALRRRHERIELTMYHNTKATRLRILASGMLNGTNVGSDIADQQIAELFG